MSGIPGKYHGLPFAEGFLVSTKTKKHENVFSFDGQNSLPVIKMLELLSIV